MADVNALHPGNPVNDETKIQHPGRSHYDLSYVFKHTLRFADLTPHFVEEGVAGDILTLYSKHDLRTYTLGAPLMDDIQMRKDYFQVPMMAILPINWDRIYTNPTIGDDVPVLANCVVPDFPRKIGRYFDEFKSKILTDISELPEGYDETDSTFLLLLKDFLQFLVTAEYFYSNGCLNKYLGYSMEKQFAFIDPYDDQAKPVSFDRFFDIISDDVFQYTDYFSVLLKSLDGATTQIFICDPSISRVGDVEFNDRISLRSLYEVLRDYPLFTISSVNLGGSSAEDLVTAIARCQGCTFLSAGEEEVSVPFNFGRDAAYQMICTHFYSNDHVDYIYSADLYRQNVQDVINHSLNFTSGSAVNYFTWNGLKCNYDSLSGYFFDTLMNLATTDSSYIGNFSVYLSLLFGYRRSLRFVDYFTGSRTQPLAVGDTGVAVNNNVVDVIDTTRKLQYARFWNQVQRAGRKIGDYVRAILNVEMQPDFHNPLFLAHTNDSIFSTENENTANGQKDANAITSNLRANADRYAFEFHCDRESIVIGITYFDIPRSYAHSVDRLMYVQDRFDMFNPSLQFIGDQEIRVNEIDNGNVDNQDYFGYTTRHMEFKQRIPRAVGGFVENLPGWTFIADNVPGKYYPNRLSPSFIRSSNVEMDPFFTSLTGFSLGSYWHFIVKAVNTDNSERKMIENPGLLG